MFVLAVFLASYFFFVLLPGYRSLTACIGAALLIASGSISFTTALRDLVLWNVIALFIGTLIIAELFMQSKMPTVIAEWCIDRSKTVRGSIMVICALSSILSMFVENVAVVLIIAPIALSLCRRINYSPVKPILLLAMYSNIQGTATLIGDPPSMILGGYLKMSFNDFFFYYGKPSIFFIIQAGALAVSIYTFFLLRKLNESIALVPVERALSKFPTLLLIGFILLLSFSSYFDPDFKWFAGTTAISFAGIGLIWYELGPKWTSVKQLLRQLDWETTFFLIGLFILVGSLEVTGWITEFADYFSSVLTSSLAVNFILLIFFSVLISAFVDNVPYILTMIPVIQQVSEENNIPLILFVFALLIGTCLGGNMTPIGSSTNIVAVGILKKHGYTISFPAYLRLGVPFTFIAVTVSATALWIIWK